VNKSSEHGDLIPDYTSFTQWTEKLRLMVCADAKSLFEQLSTEGKSRESLEQIANKLKLNEDQLNALFPKQQIEEI
jgi:hypothetical protein